MNFYLGLFLFGFIGSAIYQSVKHAINAKPKTVKLTLKKNMKKNGKLLVDGSNLGEGCTYDNPFCEEFVLFATYAVEVVDYAVMKYVLFYDYSRFFLVFNRSTLRPKFLLYFDINAMRIFINFF